MSEREPSSMLEAVRELADILHAERERMGFVWTGHGADGPMWGRDRDGGLHAAVVEEGWVLVTEDEWRHRWPDADVPPRLEEGR